MPRFISRTYYVEAIQWNGNTASIPMSFAENIIANRQGMACSVRCGGGEVRPCNLGDWLVRGMDGRIEVLPNGSFDQRYEQLHVEPVGPDYRGVTATYIGNPGADPDTEPPFLDWFNMRFPRGKAMPVRLLNVSDIEKIRLNSHFVVKDPPDDDEMAAEPVVEIVAVVLEPEPAVASSQTGTLTLNRKGR